MEEVTFECDLIHCILKRFWTLRALGPTLSLSLTLLILPHPPFIAITNFFFLFPFSERENVEANDAPDSEVGVGTSKKNRPTSANANALKLTCELLRVFITEAVQRAAAIAEAEGAKVTFDSAKSNYGVTAAKSEIPHSFTDQLKQGGRTIITIANISEDLNVMDKNYDGSICVLAETFVRHKPLTSHYLTSPEVLVLSYVFDSRTSAG
ncbi:Protein MHF2-like protein, partial [Mucuna pruriens]